MRTTLLLHVSLLFSALATVHASDGFPAFTWDHVPLYAHLGINDGLEPDQYNFLVDHFNLITFTGGRVTRDSVEPNIAAGGSRHQEAQPKGKGVVLLGQRHAEGAMEIV